MKRIHSLVIAAVALAGVTLLAAPAANAGSVGVSVSIGNGGYYNRPAYYQARPYNARPVCYQPVNRYGYYRGNPAPYYNYRSPAYRSPVYRSPVYYNHR
jgi:hypothetical protein